MNLKQIHEARYYRQRTTEDVESLLYQLKQDQAESMRNTRYIDYDHVNVTSVYLEDGELEGTFTYYTDNADRGKNQILEFMKKNRIPYDDIKFSTFHRQDDPGVFGVSAKFTYRHNR